MWLRFFLIEFLKRTCWKLIFLSFISRDTHSWYLPMYFDIFSMLVLIELCVLHFLSEVNYIIRWERVWFLGWPTVCTLGIYGIIFVDMCDEFIYSCFLVYDRIFILKFIYMTAETWLKLENWKKSMKRHIYYLLHTTGNIAMVSFIVENDACVFRLASFKQYLPLWRVAMIFLSPSTKVSISWLGEVSPKSNAYKSVTFSPAFVVWLLVDHFFVWTRFCLWPIQKTIVNLKVHGCLLPLGLYFYWFHSGHFRGSKHSPINISPWNPL